MPLFANLDSDESCLEFLTGAALLGPLTDNGGLTLTHMPGSTSAAIDKGEISVCAALGNLDQRGVSRINVDGNGNSADGNPCDLGAVERPAAITPTGVTGGAASATPAVAAPTVIMLASLLLMLATLASRSTPPLSAQADRADTKLTIK